MSSDKNFSYSEPTLVFLACMSLVYATLVSLVEDVLLQFGVNLHFFADHEPDGSDESSVVTTKSFVEIVDATDDVVFDVLVRLDNLGLRS